MIKIRGHWYDARSSARSQCELQVDESGNVSVSSKDGRSLYSGTLDELEVSSRLGSTPRFITFPQDQQLETSENDLVDQLLVKHRPRSRAGWIHRLESKKRFVLVTFIAVIAFVWAFVQYGIPAAAQVGARLVPDKVVQITGEQTLATLDARYLEPSTLPQQVRDRVRSHFEPVMARHSDLDLRVIFRSAERMGANAFALPDGTIIFTDAMVELAENDDQLLAVFAHEVGHVAHQHSMRRVIQGSLLAFMVAIISGDIAGTSEVFLGIPVVLTELAYSRGFEREADTYAFEVLRQNGKSPVLFADIMRRMEAAYQCGDEKQECKENDKDSRGWTTYLSSHPLTSKRIERAKAYP